MLDISPLILNGHFNPFTATRNTLYHAHRVIPYDHADEINHAIFMDSWPVTFPDNFYKDKYPYDNLNLATVTLDIWVNDGGRSAPRRRSWRGAPKLKIRWIVQRRTRFRRLWVTRDWVYSGVNLLRVHRIQKFGGKLLAPEGVPGVKFVKKWKIGRSLRHWRLQAVFRSDFPFGATELPSMLRQRIRRTVKFMLWYVVYPWFSCYWG